MIHGPDRSRPICALLRQRMVMRYDQDMLPFVAGQRHEFRVVGQRLCRHADFRHFIDHHAGHFLWRSLMQTDVDLWMSLTQPSWHRQHITGLRMGGGDAEACVKRYWRVNSRPVGLAVAASC